MLERAGGVVSHVRGVEPTAMKQRERCENEGLTEGAKDGIGMMRHVWVQGSVDALTAV